MNEPQDNFFLQGLGWTIKTISRSSAATPVLIFYILFSFFSFALQTSDLWKTITPWFVIVFLFLLIFMPNRLRSENYNLEMKRIGLGAKGKPLEAGEVISYQPLNQKKLSLPKRVGKI